MPALPSFRLVPILALLTMPAACGDSVAQAVRPEDPSAQAALERKKKGSACLAVGRLGEPLIVDWEAHQRADMEEAMHDGVAVVAYDCASLRLLKGCSVEGSYGFLGVSKKEEVVQIEDEDELRVNFPTSGALVARSLGAELSRGAAIDVAMVLVGKRRTTIQEAPRSALRGGAACEGATHFVRGAFVGAFALNLGTRGQVAASASVLGAAGSRSSKLSKYRDGQPETCGQVRAGADMAPESCNALVRLELVGLSASLTPPKTRDVVADDACPEGTVESGGKCVQRPTAAHRCKLGDARDCTEQCARGDAGSCNNLGTMYAVGNGVEPAPERALTFYQKACDADLALACANLGSAYSYGTGVPKDRGRAAAAYEKACQKGLALGCSNLAWSVAQGLGVPKDEARAAKLYGQACDGGNVDGCTGLGTMYASGRGVAKDEARAAQLFKRACDGGERQGCGNLGSLHEQGRGVKADRSLAVRYHRLACLGGRRDWTSCDGRNGCKDGPHWSCDALRGLGESP